MKMTQKQVEAWIDNPDNWEIIDQSKYVRLSVLRTGKHSFCRIGYVHIANMIQIYRKESNPEISWTDPLLYQFDEEHNCIGYNTSITDIRKTVYKDFKEDAA